MRPCLNDTSCVTGTYRQFVPAIGILSITVLLAACASSREQMAFQTWNDEAVPAMEAAPQGRVDAVLDIGADPTLSDYVNLALTRNLAVSAARQEWKGYLERVPQARALPDPLLSYGYYLQPVETRVGAQRQRAGLLQAFPWFGTLGLKGDVAVSEAEVAHQRYRETLQKVVREVSVAYAEYYYLGAALRITRDNIDLLAGWEGILRARYTTGGVAYSDLIKVQVELGKLEDLLTTLENQRDPRIARLRALLDLPREASLPWPDTLPSPAPMEPIEELRVHLLEGNTELKALAARVEREKYRRDLAGKASYPSLALGIDWIQTDPRDVNIEDNGQDAVIAKVAVQLPLWTGSRSAGRREAAAMHRTAIERKEDRENFLNSELDDLVFRYEDAERKTALYRDSLIPKGNQSLQAAFAAFESGEGDFLSVLDAERALLEFGLSLERSRADLVQARANVDLLTGRARIRLEE
jgi:cobalt-zinc-cadmium efflux system outer membrane protein